MIKVLASGELDLMGLDVSRDGATVRSWNSIFGEWGRAAGLRGRESDGR